MASTLHKATNNDDNIQPILSIPQEQLKQHNIHHMENVDININTQLVNEDVTTTNKSSTQEHQTVLTLQSNGGIQQNQQIGLGISLMQSSPPPHSYRHSRAYRHFKNPPQPHMCIRTITETGEEIFINVLSWTRIVIPQEPSDPIPLYGGMRVPPGSPRSPPIVFAVMANPEVLKDSGRHSKDVEERRAMVELMCDFVEAMNPGIKLIRNAIILKDRDISGELKDVWNAVQAQRDREREEQILQQRQQQHFHNITTQQMFPKTNEQTNVNQVTGLHKTKQLTSPSQTLRPAPDSEDVTDVFGIISKTDIMEKINENCRAPAIAVSPTPLHLPPHSNTTSHSQIFESKQNPLNVMENTQNGPTNQDNIDIETHLVYPHQIESDNAPLTGNDQIDAKLNNGHIDGDAVKCESQHADKNYKPNAPNASQTIALIKHVDKNSQKHQQPFSIDHTNKKNASSNKQTTTILKQNTPSLGNDGSTAAMVSTVGSSPIAQPTKKEKLGSFLPNGCIFPRFKNNKHKDKDKDKDLIKSKDKEKTLLNALKKSKEKKVPPVIVTEQSTTGSIIIEPDAKCTTTTQYQNKYCNLESEVQKLDLNKMDINTNNDGNVFIKLKVTNSNTTLAK